MIVTGTGDLKARLRAIREFFKPWGRSWADESVSLVKATGPWKDRTGTLRRSFRRKEASMRRARVVGHYTQYFVDAGTKAHYEPRHPYFSKRIHPRVAPRPFRSRVAHEALRRKPLSAALIREWNSKGGFIRLRSAPGQEDIIS